MQVRETEEMNELRVDYGRNNGRNMFHVGCVAESANLILLFPFLVLRSVITLYHQVAATLPSLCIRRAGMVVCLP